MTFRYKQRDTGEWRECCLTRLEFLRRFLMHVLPKGFHKLRYYGLAVGSPLPGVVPVRRSAVASSLRSL